MRYQAPSSSGPFGYPNHDIDPKDKDTKWGMEYARAAYYDWTVIYPKGVFSNNQGNYMENKLYAMGRQPTEKYRKLLGVDEKTNETWLNIDWRIRPIASVYLDKMVARLMAGEKGVVATPIDLSAKTAAQEKYAQAKVKITQLANQMGMIMTSSSKKRVQTAVYNMVAKGWDEGQIRNYLGQYVYFTGENLQGEGGEAIMEMREYAYAMGIKLNDGWYTARARDIVRGMATMQDMKSQILNKAKASFPQWTKQLEGGQTVADIASPYLQSMSEILELPPGSVNLFDTTVKKALNYTNPGTLAKEAKPLWQFENELRADPRWRKTKNAQDSLFQVGHQVLADFGFKY